MLCTYTSHVHMYILFVQKHFQKTKCQVSKFLTKKLTLELKLKWGTILLIGNVGVPNTFPTCNRTSKSKIIVLRLLFYLN